METYHGFVTELINEAIEDFGEGLGCNTCSRDLFGIALHTSFPVGTHIRQSGDLLVRMTAIGIVIMRAVCDLHHDFVEMVQGRDVDI